MVEKPGITQKEQLELQEILDKQGYIIIASDKPITGVVTDCTYDRDEKEILPPLKIIGTATENEYILQCLVYWKVPRTQLNLAEYYYKTVVE